MPRLPDYSKLGSPSFGAGTPLIKAPRRDQVARGLASLGTGVKRAAIAISAEAQAEAEKAKTRGDTLDVLKANTAYNEEYHPHFASFNKDADYASFGERFDEGVGPMVERAAQQIRDPDKRAKWILQRGILNQRGKQQILNHGLVLEKQDHFVTVKNAMESEANIYASPESTPEQSAGAMANLEATHKIAKRSGLVDPTNADRLANIIEQAEVNQAEFRITNNSPGVLEDLKDPKKYPNLSPEKRQALIFNYKKDGAFKVEDEGANYIVDIYKDGPDGLTDDEGKPVDRASYMDRASKLVTKRKLGGLKNKWDAATLTHDIDSKIVHMTEDDADNYIEKISERVAEINAARREAGRKDDDIGSATKEKARKSGDAFLKQIKKLREDNPALSVEGSPEVLEVKEMADSLGWGMDSLKLQEALIDARLAAQTRLDVAEPRTVSEEEAHAIMEGVSKDASDRDFRKSLQAARARVEESYPPQYARTVFEDAAALVLNKGAQDEAGGIARSIAVGDPVSQSDWRKALALDELSLTNNVFRPEIGVGTMLAAPSTIEVGPSAATAQPTFEGAKIAGNFPEAPEEAIAELKADPSTWAEFDQTFGPGAAAAALNES